MKTRYSEDKPDLRRYRRNAYGVLNFWNMRARMEDPDRNISSSTLKKDQATLSIVEIMHAFLPAVHIHFRTIDKDISLESSRRKKLEKGLSDYLSHRAENGRRR